MATPTTAWMPGRVARRSCLQKACQRVGLLAGTIVVILGRGSAFAATQQAPRPGQPDSAASQPQQAESQRLAARGALLEAIKSLDRGFAATKENRSDVSGRIADLVRWNPTSDPTSKLGGNWTLIYTDAPDIIGIPTSPFSTLGRIGQEIDASSGTIANVIEYRPSSFAVGIKDSVLEDAFVQRVFTDYKVASPTTVELNIRGLGLAPQRIFGVDVPEAFKVNLRGPLSAPFGKFEILYLDEEIRIIRTGQGWYSVNRRGVFG